MGVLRGVACACGAAVVSVCAHAQEAMYTAAATMPGPGGFVLREQIHYYRYGSNPVTGSERTETYEAATGIQYGIVRDLSVLVELPLQVRDQVSASGESDWESGLMQADVMFKYRFYKDDSGGIDTFRVAALGGTSFVSGDNYQWSGISVDPLAGCVATIVSGRHGFNQELSYRFNTGGDQADNYGGDGPSDALFYNSAYVFRLLPDRFTSESIGAWYATAEVNGVYETNGDNEIRGSLGLMYEGRKFGLEVMTQFPIWDNVRERAVLDFAVGVGVRFLF